MADSRTQAPINDPILVNGQLSQSWILYFQTLADAVEEAGRRPPNEGDLTPDPAVLDEIDALKSLTGSLLSQIEGYYTEQDRAIFSGVVISNEGVAGRHPQLGFRTHGASTNPEDPSSFIREQSAGNLFTTANLGLGRPAPAAKLDIDGGVVQKFVEVERSRATDGVSPVVAIEDLDNSIRWVWFADAQNSGRMTLRETSNSSADRLFVEPGSGSLVLEPDATGDVAIGDGVNIVLGTTTGTQIGATTLDLLSFWGGTPVGQQTDPGDVTDSSGGTADGTLAAVSGSGDDSTINNNFADLASKVNSIFAALRNPNWIG